MARKVLSFLFFSAGVFAANLATPTIDQSLSMKSVSAAQISPDGRYVAYVVTQTNWEENDFTQQIWISQTATGERYYQVWYRNPAPFCTGATFNQTNGWRVRWGP